MPCTAHFGGAVLVLVPCRLVDHAWGLHASAMWTVSALQPLIVLQGSNGLGLIGTALGATRNDKTDQHSAND